jgi:hypothetical protein
MLLSRGMAWCGQGKSQTKFFSGAKGGQLPPILATIFFNQQKKGQESFPPKNLAGTKIVFCTDCACCFSGHQLLARPLFLRE